MDGRGRGMYDGIEGRMVMDSMRSDGGERGRMPISVSGVFDVGEIEI